MKPLYALAGVTVLVATLAMPLMLAAGDAPPVAAPSVNASPIYGVTLPAGYRDWQFAAPATKGAPLDELRAVLGNRTGLEAYRSGTLPFPDGSPVNCNRLSSTGTSLPSSRSCRMGNPNRES